MQRRDKITADEVKRAPEGTLTLIDIRKNPDDRQIRGSVRYNGQKLLEAEKLSLPISHDQTVVVYCGSGNSCVRVAERLREQGFEGAVALEGGYEAAKEAGLPLEEISRQQPIPGEETTGTRLL